MCSKKIDIALFLLLYAQTLLSLSFSNAAPLDTPQKLNDKNIKISFEVHSPWNILDGVAQEIGGEVSIKSEDNSDKLSADLEAQDIRYKAGLSVAGRLVSAWLQANPPTPAKFVIQRSRLICKREPTLEEEHCSGTVDGKLNIWQKDYVIDIPVDLKRDELNVTINGMKEIQWGEYGFGDPTSTIANLKPVIELKFEIGLPAFAKKPSNPLS